MELELFPIEDKFVFDNHRFAGYGGGWGNGKSLSLCLKAIMESEKPNNLGLIGRKTYPELRDTTQKQFFELRPDWKRFFNQTEATLKLPNGSEIVFRHLDEWEKLTNYNLGWFAIDQAEEIEERCFVWLQGRLRRYEDAKSWISFNMNGHDWIWRRFKKDAPTFYEDKYALASIKGDYFLAEAQSFANPHLPNAYVRWLKELPEGVRKRYVEGSWDYFAGQIYDDFDERIHEIDGFDIPEWWEMFRTWDYGYQNPNTCYWVATDSAGNVFIADELYQAGKLPSWHKRIVTMRTGKRIISLDPACPKFFQTESDGKKVAHEYAEEPNAIFLTPMPIGQNLRIVRMKEYMKPREGHTVVLPDGRILTDAPKLFLFKGKCPNLKGEILQYAWKDIQDFEGASDQKFTEKPKDTNNHGIEAIERIVGGYLWHPPEYKPEPEPTFADKVYRKLFRKIDLRRVV